MILIIMYHRLVGLGKLSNCKSLFCDHLKYIKDHYPVILPGDPAKQLSICLTFDDAFFDFYSDIFPLLEQMNLRAVLGVPTKYILEKSDRSKEQRLSIPYHQAQSLYKQAPYCTWQELKEIAHTGLVEIASHSHSHPNMTLPGIDLHQEMILSKQLIEEHLSQSVSTFIYPFGKTNQHLHREIKKVYAYDMRIGEAINDSWQAKKPLCRINGDCLSSVAAPFKIKSMIQYFVKYAVEKLPL